VLLRTDGAGKTTAGAVLADRGESRITNASTGYAVLGKPFRAQ
jgi:hypothetical protein